MRWPDAEIEVSAVLVQELLRRQHPDLADFAIREMSPGFDNTIWRLGDDLVIRLPRRLVAVPLIENEQRWLPYLAPRLPLSIPTPLRVGRPSEIFPWPWTIAEWIEGTPGNFVDPKTRGRAATSLGTCFRALHRDAPADAPTNEFRAVPLMAHDVAFRSRLEEIGNDIDHGEVLQIWRKALDAEAWALAPKWIHGDPHPANLIFRGDVLVGVIDFGDLCAGDPATDLAGGFLALPWDSIEHFVRAYGDVDDATLRRTLGWAVHFALVFILLGQSDEMSYGPLGLQAVDNAIAVARRLG